MIKLLTIKKIIFFLAISTIIFSSCTKQLQSNTGGFSDISLSRNSDEYTVKRINTIEMQGSSLFGIPGFGSNNKNKNKYGMLFRFNWIEMGKIPRILPFITLVGSSIALGGYAQQIAGLNKNNGRENLPTGLNYLAALPFAGIVNNLVWSGSATSGITNQIHYNLINDNPGIDFFTNPKYTVDYKLGLFGQKAKVKLNIIGATLKIK